jgi:thiamine biosynthesis lipoprotein
MTTDPTSSRRAFLTGQPVDASATAEPDAGQTASPATSGQPGGDRFLVQFSREAMACRFAVFLNAGQYSQGPQAALDALERVDRLEAQMTIYRADSELAEINRRAAGGAVAVESELFRLFERCQQLHADTDGAFDITSTPLTRLWGFYRRQGRLPAAAEIEQARAQVGSQHVELDSERRTVRFLRPGVELNLGSIGKGYALDCCAAALEAEGVEHFLMHGGQSSVLARGSHASRTAAGGWVVGVGHPLRPERLLAELYVRNRGLGTSGSGTQFFRFEGRRFGHILDPRTGWPAEGVFSVTVVAPTAAEADALATAFYVAGVDTAQHYCQQHSDVGMLMLLPSRDGSRVELATANLAENDFRAL